LLKLIRPELRLALRAALHQAVQLQTAIEAPHLPWTKDGQLHSLTIRVKPVTKEGDTAKGFLLVIFELHEQAPPAEKVVLATEAVNEELRSAAEELETSKEELQAINEELRTVNQELKVKIEEMSVAGNNLQNLINSAGRLRPPHLGHHPPAEVRPAAGRRRNRARQARAPGAGGSYHRPAHAPDAGAALPHPRRPHRRRGRDPV
nr:hypothetical protein [Tanacetum cinerariifolium]